MVFNCMTADQMLHRTARVKRGERLLVHGADQVVWERPSCSSDGSPASICTGLDRELRAPSFQPPAQRRSTTPRAAKLVFGTIPQLVEVRLRPLRGLRRDILP